MNNIGFGAGYAGFGGYVPEAGQQSPGAWYGVVTSVTQPGSGGGNSDGGAGGSGGGLLKIALSNILKLEGDHSAVSLPFSAKSCTSMKAYLLSYFVTTLP